MTNTLLSLFLPIIIGYLLVRIKYLNISISRDIRLFVIRVAVPCRIFISMYNTDLGTLKQILPLSIAYVLLTIFLIFSTFLILYKVKDKKVKAAYILSISFANYGYIGWAVLDASLGAEGLSRGMFFTTLWWPGIYAGTFLIGKLLKIDNKLNVKDFILNISVPSTVLILGIICNLLNIPIFDPLIHTVTELGDMTVTLILFTVGLTISISASFREIKTTIIPVLLRPLLGVIGGFLIINLIGISDPISRSTILIESMMPIAVLSVILGVMLDLDENLMSSMLILSTLLSLLTIPISLALFT